MPVEPYVDEEGREWPGAMTGEGEWPDFSALAGEAPFDKPKPEYNHVERRAELFAMIQEHSHPKNLEQSQSKIGERFGVSQQMISKDMQTIREYVAAHDPTRAKAVVGWLSEKTVTKFIDAAERKEEAGELDEAASLFKDALDAQMELVEYMMDTGDMDSSADQLEIEGTAGDMYMNMLRSMHEKDSK